MAHDQACGVGHCAAEVGEPGMQWQSVGGFQLAQWKSAVVIQSVGFWGAEVSHVHLFWNPPPQSTQ